MEELGQTLDEEEFIDAAVRLYESVPLPQKNIILKLKDKEKSKLGDDSATSFKVTNLWFKYIACFKCEQYAYCSKEALE